jgi:DNA-binding NarL/FixJ family response regulator
LNKIRVLIADDESLLLDLMSRILKLNGNLEFIGTASSGREVIQVALNARPDVILMDVAMNDIDGIEATRTILSELPDTRIIAFSGHGDHDVLRQMFKAGAVGYILKQCSFDEIEVAIREVSEGRIYMSPPVARKILEAYIGQPSNQHTVTARENQILQLIGSGKRMKEIAFELNISVKTAYTHRQNLMEKLGTDTVINLIRVGKEKGLLYMD